MSKAALTFYAPVIFLLLWSGGFTVAKIGIADASPITLLALRYFCVVALLVPFYLVLKPPLPKSRAAWGHLTLVGFLVQVVYFGAAYLAFNEGMSAGGVALITSLQPILVALVMPALSSEKLSPGRWLGFALGLTGAVIVIISNAEVKVGSVAGLLFAFAALFAIAAAIVWEKLFGIEQHPVTANLVQYAIGLGFTLPLAWALEDMHVNWTLSFSLALGYLVVLNSILAISLLLMMIRRGEATRVSALFFLVPPISALIAWPALGETMAPQAWTGLVIAAAGVWLVTRRARLKK